MILLAPFCLVLLARSGQRAPIAVRLALRDLDRYRARSGSALSAISLGVLDRRPGLHPDRAAVRQRPRLRRAEPGLEPAHRLHAQRRPRRRRPGQRTRRTRPRGPPARRRPRRRSPTASPRRSARNNVIELDQTSASLQHAAAGRSWSGPVYVATPQLLAAFGIKASEVNPNADILTMRPGLSGISHMQLVYGNYFGNGQAAGQRPGQRAAHQLPVPEERLPGQPGDPGGRRPSVRHLGTQHRDHRARRAQARPADQRLRLAHPDPAPAHRRADQQRQAHRGGGAA